MRPFRRDTTRFPQPVEKDERVAIPFSPKVEWLPNERGRLNNPDIAGDVALQGPFGERVRSLTDGASASQAALHRQKTSPDHSNPQRRGSSENLEPMSLDRRRQRTRVRSNVNGHGGITPRWRTSTPFVQMVSTYRNSVVFFLVMHPRNRVRVLVTTVAVVEVSVMLFESGSRTRLASQGRAVFGSGGMSRVNRSASFSKQTRDSASRSSLGASPGGKLVGSLYRC